MPLTRAGDPPAPALLLAVNVGRPRVTERRGKATATAIDKRAVDGRVAVAGVNLAGDEQADLVHHGGRDQAVYAYAREDYEWWEGELGRELASGMFGENLTLAGVDVSGALVGERWEIGSVALEVTSPRIPCWKLARKVGDPRFIKRFAAAGRPGAYLRILHEGELGAGDPVRIVSRPDHDVSVAAVSHVRLHAHEEAAKLLAAPALPVAWREWVQETIGRAY